MTKPRSIIVFEPGAGCRVANLDDTPATIIGVLVGAGGYAQYRVAYWINGQRHEVYVEACEVRVCEPEPPTIKIGFAREAA